jgi:hypothetical protein
VARKYALNPPKYVFFVPWTQNIFLLFNRTQEGGVDSRGRLGPCFAPPPRAKRSAPVLPPHTPRLGRFAATRCRTGATEEASTWEMGYFSVDMPASGPAAAPGHACAPDVASRIGFIPASACFDGAWPPHAQSFHYRPHARPELSAASCIQLALYPSRGGSSSCCSAVWRVAEAARISWCLSGFDHYVMALQTCSGLVSLAQPSSFSATYSSAQLEAPAGQCEDA